jgi:hypothetical protein
MDPISPNIFTFLHLYAAKQHLNVKWRGMIMSLLRCLKSYHTPKAPYDTVIHIFSALGGAIVSVPYSELETFRRSGDQGWWTVAPEAGGGVAAVLAVDYQLSCLV